MKVKWLVDEYLDETRRLETGMMTLAEAVASTGREVVSTRYRPFERSLGEIPYGENDMVICHGSHEFIKAVERAYPNWWPRAFCRRETHAFHTFAAHWGVELLNDDFVLVPWSEFVRRGASWFRHHDAVFVKPSSVTKAFTGRVIAEKDFAHEINCMSQIERPEPDLLTVVASPKMIDGEFRFVCVDGRVVAQSEYRWDGKLDVRADVHPAARALADRVAAHHWTPDEAFVVDVAIVNRDPVFPESGDARIVEFNVFSCSGLYACDTVNIVNAVSALAEQA